MNPSNTLGSLQAMGYIKEMTKEEKRTLDEYIAGRSAVYSVTDSSGNSITLREGDADRLLETCEKDISVLLEFIGVHENDIYGHVEQALKAECSLRLINVITNKVRECWDKTNAIQPQLELV